MKTKKIGELLRERRESHRLSLEQVARLTHLKLEYLRCIEENQFDQLPPAVYVKGYVRTIAEVFGVDPLPLLALLRRDYKESDAGVLQPQELTKRRRVALWRGPILWPSLLVGALLATIVLYVWVQWFIAQQPPKLVVDNLAALTEIAPDAELSGRSSPEAIVLVNNQPAALRPDGSFSYRFQLEQTGLVTIRIEARDQRGRSTVIEKTVRVVPTEQP